MANLNTWIQGLTDCTTISIRCPGLLTALSIHQIALSNVERGHKLYKSANQQDRTIHFSLEMGYYAVLPALTALPSGK